MARCPVCSGEMPDGTRFCPDDGTPLHPGDALIGRTIFGQYKIVGKLGEGGMGAVYLAEQVNIDQKVALKVLHPHLAKDQSLVERFHREGKAATCLKHPNIVTVLIVGKLEDGTLYLAMEYVEGESLARKLEREGPLAPLQVCHLAGQIAGALEEAHGQGIVHRDLKPENILLTERLGIKDFVKVLDFGIAQIRDKEGRATRLTKAGAIFGTPAYLSPEQALGQEADPRSDLYSLGVIMYELLVGRPPFFSENVTALLALHVTGEVPSLRGQGLAQYYIPLGLEALVMRCLAKSPDARFPDVSALKRALEEARQEVQRGQDQGQSAPEGAVGTRPLADMALGPTEELRAEVGDLLEGGYPATRPALKEKVSLPPTEVHGPQGGGGKAMVLVGMILLLAALLGYYWTMLRPQDPAVQSVQAPDQGVVQTLHDDKSVVSVMVDLLDGAQRAFDEGHLTGADSAWELAGRALEVDSGNESAKAMRERVLEALLRQAQGLEGEGRWSEALEGYRSVLSLAPESALAKERMGEIEERLREDEERKDRAEQRKRFNALIASSRKRAQRGQFEAAERELDQARKIDGRALRLHLAYGDLYLDQKKLDQAAEAYQRALKVKASSDSAHVGLGKVALCKGALAEAQGHFKEALKHDSSNGEAKAGLTKAEEMVQGTRAKDLVVKGKRALGSGSYQTALVSFKEALKVDKRNVQALVGLGQSLGKLGRTRRAHQAIKRALEMDPKNSEALKAMEEFQRGRAGYPYSRAPRNR